MECPLGSVCRESEHRVTTIEKAQEWFKRAEEKQMPITVQQIKASNGRLIIKIYSASGELIHSRG